MAEREDRAALNRVTQRTSLGWIAVVGSPRGVCGLAGPCERRRDVVRDVSRRWPAAAAGPCACVSDAGGQVAEYLDGRRDAFDVALDLSGLTAFQRRILAACLRIAYGTTCSYAELARLAGCARGARAVGRALAANPVPLLVPCHRVVRADGGLGGFSAQGGVGLKRRLLALESARVASGPAG